MARSVIARSGCKRSWPGISTVPSLLRKTGALVRQRKTCDSARHADRQGRVARFFRISFAVRIEKHLLGRGRRRGFAIVDSGIFARLAEMDDHEAAATDIAGARVSHRKRKADRHRSVHRVAAAIENFDPDASGALLLRL